MRPPTSASRSAASTAAPRSPARRSTPPSTPSRASPTAGSSPAPSPGGRSSRSTRARRLKLPGVIQVFSHENRPGLAWFDSQLPRPDRAARLPVPPALRRGDPFQRPAGGPGRRRLSGAGPVSPRRWCGSSTNATPHATDLQANLETARTPKERAGIKPPPKPRGHADEALAASPVRVDAEYRGARRAPQPDGDVRDDGGAGRGRDAHRLRQDPGRAERPRLPLQRARLQAGRGPRRLRRMSAGPSARACARSTRSSWRSLAARELKRSVRVALTRQQMFSLGHRPMTRQRVALGASADGTLQAVIHEATAETSRYEDYSEEVVNWSGLLYRCDNARFDHKVVPLDLPTPCDMRAPGAVWGLFALECAMDELAVGLGIDPVELRLKNYAEEDQNDGKPFSSKELRECYRQAAERFGWAGATRGRARCGGARR